MNKGLLICVAASLVRVSTLTAQSHEEEEVLDVIAVMFEGLAQRDTAKTLQTPSARQAVVRDPQEERGEV